MLPEFSKARILVVGDLMLDRYWHGVTARISPEAPVPVVGVDREDARLGGAGNVAANASALGAKVCLLALVGDDGSADQVENMLSAAGVSCWLQRVPGSRTICKLRVISRHQQLIRLDFEDNFIRDDNSALLTEFEKRLPNTDVVILSDYAKGTLMDCGNLISAAKRAGVVVVVDPKGDDFSRYAGASIITPNFSEFETVVGRCEDESDVRRNGKKLCRDLDADALLVTRSERGMTLFQREGDVVHLETQAKDVFDVTGAGDTVVATLAGALGAGVRLKDAVNLSNMAAGIAVTKLGTATVSPRELERAQRSGRNYGVGDVFDESGLFERIRVARNGGEKIVMTNGCFDILHPGHVDYLEKARALGDRLVIAVNDDASVRRLKGDGRPINTLEVRARMLSALACVDWVVSFSEDTPERIISRLQPDILVKGGDYAVEDIVGGRCVRDAGGQVRVLDFISGYSTTDLIERIRNENF